MTTVAPVKPASPSALAAAGPAGAAHPAAAGRAPRVKTLVKRWSNAGQTLVKHWPNAGQTLVKRESNTAGNLAASRGCDEGGRTAAGVKHWSKTGQLLVKCESAGQPPPVKTRIQFESNLIRVGAASRCSEAGARRRTNLILVKILVKHWSNADLIRVESRRGVALQ